MMQASEENGYMGGVTDRLMPVNTVFQQDLDDNAELTVQDVLVRAGITEETISKAREEVQALMRPITSDAELKELQPVLTKLVKMRTTIKHVCEKGREEANMVRNAYIKVQKRFTGYVTEIEEPLVRYKQEWKAEQERIKQEEEAEALRQLQVRYAALEAIGCVRRTATATEPERYVIGGTVIPLDMIDTADAPTWDTLIAQARMVADEERAKREQEEAAKKAEADRIEAEKAAMEEQRRKLADMIRTARAAELRTLGMVDEAGGYLSVYSAGEIPTVLYRITIPELERWNEDEYTTAKIYATNVVAQRDHDANNTRIEAARTAELDAAEAQELERPIKPYAQYTDERWLEEVRMVKVLVEKRKADEERERIVAERVKAMKDAGWEDGRAGSSTLELLRPDMPLIVNVGNLHEASEADLAMWVDLGQAELTRRKAAEEERIRQQERERLTAEEQARKEAEALRIAQMDDAAKWEEWVAEVKATAPKMDSHIGKHAVDRVLKGLDGITPSLLADLKR